MSDFLLTISNSLLVGIITVLVSYLGLYFSKRLKAKEKNNKKQIEDIAGILEKQEAQKVISITEKVLEKMPTGLKIEEFQNQLNEFAQIIAKFEKINSNEFHAVENLINSYHEQALEQAKIQFWFSISAAAVGFALIIYYGAQIESDNYLTIFKILPGVIMDSVAFLFFRQASETRERATALYDRLRTDTRNAESIALVASIEDYKVRSAVRAQIALHLAGLNPNPIEFTNFLTGKSDITDGSK
jgi:hypothetical protein